MFKSIGIFGCLLILLSPYTSSAQNLLNEPEGIVYDSIYNRYLVSCWRNGAVIAIDSNGTQSYFRSGLGNCASIIISGDTVFVAINNNAVAGLDLVTGATKMYCTFPGAGGCHDMAVDTSGYLYATDRHAHRIYRVDLSDNTYIDFVTISDGIYSPLGLEYDIFNNRLIVAAFDDDTPIRAVSLPDGIVTDIVDPGLPSLDGITRDHLGNYYFTTFTGGLNGIYRFDSTFSRPPELIQDGFNGLVDVCYNRRENILAATEYFEHTVHYLPMYGHISLDHYNISDATYGDGDGVPEGGETVELTFQMYNSGVEAVSDLTVSLTVDDPSLKIISGSIDLGDLPVQATVSNTGSPFLIEIPSGYLPRYNTFYHEAVWESRFGLEVDTLEVRAIIGECNILLVDDDFGDNIDVYFTEVLDDWAIPYKVVEVSPAPTLTEMNSYDIVIWFTGDLLIQPLDGDEIDSLAAYLDNGGQLFLTGQHIAKQLDGAYPGFLHDYLKSEYVISSMVPVLEALPGGQVFDSTDELYIYGYGGASNQTVPGHLTTVNGGVGEMKYGGQSTLAAVSYDGAYRSVFFAFGFEAIINNDSRYTERGVILAEILDFFGYQMPAIPLMLSVAPGDPTHLIDHLPDISWQPGDPEYVQAEYHIQVGSDNDWSAAEMWDFGPIAESELSVVYAGTELMDGETYFFRIKTNDGEEWSPWYYGNFRMNSAPTIPLDLSPDNMEEVDTATPALRHANSEDGEGDGLTYSYELYDDGLMSSLAAQASEYSQGSGGTTVWTVPSILPDGEDYFWRVRAGDGYEYGDWSELASFYILPFYVCGDANGDESVNVGDAVFIINYVFKSGPAPEILEAADANADGQCNVADAVYLINHIFKGGAAPLCP